MQHKLSTDVQRYANRRRRNTRHRLLGCIAGILVFCITYAALLPAISQAAPYISDAVKSLVAPTYEYNPSDKYTSYTYSDNDIDVVVQLPADSNVPKDAILRVTPIKETHAEYASLASKAEKAVNGAVKQAQFYDISFYTEQMEYIPVDDRAKVSINYSAPTMDVDSDIVVLHYDENDDNPITLDKTDFTEEPYTCEQELTFETDGFSVFAVVELTAKYEAVETIKGLEGKSYIIAGVNVDGGNFEKESTTPKKLPVLTSEAIGTFLKPRKADGVKYESVDEGDYKLTSITLSNYADAVWTFEKAGAGTYFIKSSGGKYLFISGKNQLEVVSNQKQEFRVVAASVDENKDLATNAVCIQAVVNGCYVNLPSNNSESAYFSSWDGDTTDKANHLVLVEYEKQVETKYDATQQQKVSILKALAGRSFIIAGVNFKDNDNTALPVLTSSNEGVSPNHLASRQTENVGLDGDKVTSVKLADSTNAVWTFEDAGNGTYYIKSSGERYLYAKANEVGLFLGNASEKQEFEVVAASYVNASTNDVRNAVCIYSVGTGKYVNVVGNYPYYVNDGDQGAFSGYDVLGENDIAERGNHLVLIEVPTNQEGTTQTTTFSNVVDPTDTVIDGLAGLQFVITNIGGYAITGTASNDRLGQEQVTIADDQSFVKIPNESSTNLVWEFEAAGIPGRYYIKNLKTGKYLHIYESAQEKEKPLTLSDEKQAIEVLSANDDANQNAVWIRYPNSGLYVDESGNNKNGGNAADYNCIDWLYESNFGVWNKSQDGLYDTNEFLLTNYTIQPMTNVVDPSDPAPLGNLDGKTMVITLPANDDVNKNAVLTNIAIGNNTKLQAQEVEKKDGVWSLSTDTPIANVKWKFTSAGEANQYWIQDSNGKYLNIDGRVVRLTEVQPTMPITVHDNGDGTVVLYVVQADKVYSINLYNNNINDGFGAWEVEYLDNPAGNIKLKLTEVAEFEQNSIVDTNLDGKIVAIVWDNNNGSEYAALSSTSVNTNNLEARIVTKDGKNYISSDEYNDLVWQFEAVPGQPGCYKIKVANYYGGDDEKNENGDLVPLNENKGNYLTITKEGLGLTADSNAEGTVIEVVPATNTDIEDAVCLRTKINGYYYYLDLYAQDVNNYFVSIGTDEYGIGSTGYWAHTGDHGNHFVLTTLIDEDVAKILALPKDAEELEKLVGPVGNPNEDYEEEVAYRNQIIADVNYLWNKYFAENATSELTALQKNFLGKEKAERLEADMQKLHDWLNREPEVVPATRVAAKVQVFNYDENVNTLYYDEANDKYIALPGFSFFQGGHGYGDHGHNGDDSCVDGPGGHDGNELEEMYPTLVDGYPQYVSYYYLDKNNNNQKVVIPLAAPVSLEGLFSDKYLESENTDIMNNGGGLFRYDEATGYYYYYSDLNAAYFDGNQFTLYDAVTRPEYQEFSGAPADNSNFLPFNKVVGSVIYDYDYETNSYNTTNRYVNSGILNEVKPETTILNEKVDLWFGMTVDIDFLQPKGGMVVNGDNSQPMIFDFHGDDDVFVYIDGVLVLNIGGAHAAQSASIDFSTGIAKDPNENSGEGRTLRKIFEEAAKAYEDDQIYIDSENSDIIWVNGKEIKFEGDTFADYSSHKLNFFYMERGGNISYCGIKFNLITLPEKSLAVSKTVEMKDEQGNPVNVNDQTYYTFRILQAHDDNNDGKLSPFFKAGMTFEVTENGKFVDFGYIDPNTGMFSLKAGQIATFYDLLGNALDPTEEEFIVQEIIYNEETGQYQAVTINSETVTGEELERDTINEDDYLKGNAKLWGLNAGDKVYTSSNVAADVGGFLEYTNTVNPPTSTLKITKNKTVEADFGNQEFKFVVLLGDERIVSSGTTVVLNPIPVGTKYTVTGEEESRTVTEAGIITLKVGETATIEGLVQGTNYEVYEIVEENKGYMVEKYEVTGEGTFVTTASSASGEITGKDQTVTVTITNAPFDFAINLHISKQVIGYNKTDTFIFDIERGEFDSETGTWETAKDLPNAIITVDGEEIEVGTAVVGFKNDEVEVGKDYYILIQESRSDVGYIYDSTKYIATITIWCDEGKNMYAEMTKLQKIVYNPDGSYKQLVNVDKDTNTDEFPITFVNYGTYATVTKHVTAGDTNGTFHFTALIGYDSNIDFTWPTNSSYVVGETKPARIAQMKYTTISFDLQDGDSVSFPIPTNSTVTVTETNPEGYITSYQVINTSTGTGNVTSGTKAEATVTTGPLTINFFNQGGYKLPETGGAGTQFYTFGGLLLMAVPLMYGYKRKRAWKGGEMA